MSAHAGESTHLGGGTFQYLIGLFMTSWSAAVVDTTQTISVFRVSVWPRSLHHRNCMRFFTPCSTKDQIPLGPVPRNFLVANVTRKSLTSYRLVTRKLATFRPSRHVKMVWRVANFLVTSRPCRTYGILRTTRQADKPAADRRSTNHASAWKLRHCLRKRMAASGTCFISFSSANFR